VTDGQTELRWLRRATAVAAVARKIDRYIPLPLSLALLNFRINYAVQILHGAAIGDWQNTGRNGLQDEQNTANIEHPKKSKLC